MKKIILSFLSLCVFCTCGETLTSPLPSYPVNIELDLNFADSDLVPALAAKSFTRRRKETDRIGFGGVLVVHGHSPNGSMNLYAYDLACPHEARVDVQVIPDDQGTARCPKCGSVYITLWGTGLPEKNALSKYPLRSFVVKPVGGNRFVVAN
jgi:hypothetical protein